MLHFPQNPAEAMDEDQRRSPPGRLSFDRGTLRLEGIDAAVLTRLFEWGDWVFDGRDHCFRTDACRYCDVAQTLRTHLRRGQWVDDVPAWQSIAWPARRLPTLRGDQRQAADAWLASGCRGTVVMPTGTGKTVVALDLAARCGGSTLIVAPIRDLMYQWHARILQTFGIDAGIIGDGVHRVSPISVTTYDSAAIHAARLGDRFELIIFDEVHHLPGPWRADAARMSAAPMRLGLTATPPQDPDRLQRLGELIGQCVYSQAIADARGQTLARYQVKRIAVHLESAQRERYTLLGQRIQKFVTDRRKEDPGFRWDQIYSLVATDMEARRCLRAFRQKRRMEERSEEKLRVLEDLFRLHAGTPVLVFVGSNAMARDVSMRFLIPCLLSHCRKRERADLLTGLAEGRYPALVANRVLDEGVDLPAVNVAIVLGGSSSTRQATQRLGRVLRKGHGDRAVLYEVVTAATGEVQRSRQRRRGDAFKKAPPG